MTTAAINSHANFISFEEVVDQNGQTLILMPMSRIAGTTDGIWAEFFQNYIFINDASLRLKSSTTR